MERCEMVASANDPATHTTSALSGFAWQLAVSKQATGFYTLWVLYETRTRTA